MLVVQIEFECAYSLDKQQIEWGHHHHHLMQQQQQQQQSSQSPHYPPATTTYYSCSSSTLPNKTFPLTLTATQHSKCSPAKDARVFVWSVCLSFCLSLPFFHLSSRPTGHQMIWLLSFLLFLAVVRGRGLKKFLVVIQRLNL